MKNTTLEGWRRELAATNLEAVKRPVPIEQWVGAQNLGALDRLLCAVAYGATLEIGLIDGSRPALGWFARIESSSGALHGRVEAERLGDALAQLAEQWRKL